MPIAPRRTKIMAGNTVIEEMLPLMPPGRNYPLLDEELPGSNALVKRFLYDPWDGEVVVAEPGEPLTFEHFRTVVGPA